jgi:hypothetical protein
VSAFHRRIQVRKGAQTAVMALAHHLITIVYNVLARGEEYVEPGGDCEDQKNKPKVVSRLVARLTKLGYYVELKSVNAESSQELSPAWNREQPGSEQNPVLADIPAAMDSGIVQKLTR